MKAIATLLLVLACALPRIAMSQGLFSMFTPSKTGAEADPKQVASKANEIVQPQDAWLRPFLLTLYVEGEWGSVLNLSRMGLAAMEQKKLPLAQRSFDEAILRVEAIYANDENAIKAKSVFNEEMLKDFKGEPYERAMLYYYRGILYANSGDYQNARAAFLAADRHDTLSSAESEAFVGTFGLMKYLAAWASQCDGDTTRAGHLLTEAKGADAKIRSLPDSFSNSIILVDTGPGPVKWGDGEYKEVLKFKPGEGADPTFTINLESGPVTAAPVLVGDVNYQATNRGGREIDGVLNGKAKFKSDAGAVGDVATNVGMVAALAGLSSGNNNMAGVGMAGMLIGLVAKGIEAATTPAADIRAWDTLPGKIVMVSEKDIAAAPLKLVMADKSSPVPLQATNGECSLAWARTSSALSTDSGGTAQFSPPKASEANRGDRNKAFRDMVQNELVATK
jgi:hypothetical protein